MNIWDKTKELKFTLPSDLTPGISVEYPMGSEYEELRFELVKFIEWVEENYNVQIPVLVDFVDKNYLVENGKRCGYLFYYQEFINSIKVEEEIKDIFDKAKKEVYKYLDIKEC